MIGLPIPIPVEPALTVSLGRRAIRAKLSATQAEASALSYSISRCHHVGSTVVCSFSMRMRFGITCSGRVQVRAYSGGIEGRYVGPRRHPKAVVCK